MEEMFMAGSDGQLSYVDTGQDLKLDQGSHQYITSNGTSQQAGILYTTTNATQPDQQPQQVYIIQQPVQQQPANTQYVYERLSNQHVQVLQTKQVPVAEPIKQIVTMSQPAIMQTIQLTNQVPVLQQIPVQAPQTLGQSYTIIQKGTTKYLVSPSIDMSNIQRGSRTVVSFARQTTPTIRQPVQQSQIVVQSARQVRLQAPAQPHGSSMQKLTHANQYQENFLKQLEQKTNASGKGKKPQKSPLSQQRQQLSQKLKLNEEKISEDESQRNNPPSHARHVLLQGQSGSLISPVTLSTSLPQVVTNINTYAENIVSTSEGAYLSISEEQDSMNIHSNVSIETTPASSTQAPATELQYSTKLTLQQYKERNTNMVQDIQNLHTGFSEAKVVIVDPKTNKAYPVKNITNAANSTTTMLVIQNHEQLSNDLMKSNISVSRTESLQATKPKTYTARKIKIVTCQNCGVETDSKLFCHSCKHSLKPLKKMSTLSKLVNKKEAPVTVSTTNDLPNELNESTITKQDFYGKNNSIRVISSEKKQPVVMTARGGKGASNRGKGRSKVKSFEEPEILTLSSDDDDESSKASTNSGQTVNKSVTGSGNSNASVTTVPIKLNPKEPLLVSDIEDIMCSAENCQVRLSGFPVKYDKDSDVNITCRSVLIGSFKFVPNRNISIIPFKAIIIPTPSASEVNDGSFVDFPVVIPFGRMIKMLIHYGNQMPMLILYVQPSEARKIRNHLKMVDKSRPYFDPISNVQSHKRIVILLGKYDDQLKQFFKNFLNLELYNKVTGSTTKLVEEITYREANDILVQSSSTEASAGDVKVKTECTSSLLIYPSPPNKGGITITTADYKLLEEPEFLNDVILDFYLKWLLLNKMTKENRDRTHIFSTFFYKRLTTKPRKAARPSNASEDPVVLTAAEKRHARVKSWTKNVDIFTKDFVLIPINEHCHWFLAVICFLNLDGPVSMSDGKAVISEPKKEQKAKAKIQMPVTEELESDRDEAEGDEEEMQEDEEEEKKQEEKIVENVLSKDKLPKVGIKQPCIMIFDSLAAAPRSRVVATLRDYLSVEYVEKKKTKKIFSKDTMKGMCPKVPQQINFYDCGVFTLQYAQNFFEKPLKCFRNVRNELLDWFPQQVVAAKREGIAKLIKSLMDEYKPNHDIILPPINFNSLRMDINSQIPSEAQRLLESKRKFDAMQHSTPHHQLVADQSKRIATGTSYITVTNKPLNTAKTTAINSPVMYNVLVQTTPRANYNASVLDKTKIEIVSSMPLVQNVPTGIPSRISMPVVSSSSLQVPKAAGTIEIKDEDDVLLIVNKSSVAQIEEPSTSDESLTCLLASSHDGIISNASDDLLGSRAILLNSKTVLTASCLNNPMISTQGVTVIDSKNIVLDNHKTINTLMTNFKSNSASLPNSFASSTLRSTYAGPKQHTTCLKLSTTTSLVTANNPQICLISESNPTNVQCKPTVSDGFRSPTNISKTSQVTSTNKIHNSELLFDKLLAGGNETHSSLPVSKTNVKSTKKASATVETYSSLSLSTTHPSYHITHKSPTINSKGNPRRNELQEANDSIPLKELPQENTLTSESLSSIPINSPNVAMCSPKSLDSIITSASSQTLPSVFDSSSTYAYTNPSESILTLPSMSVPTPTIPSPAIAEFSLPESTVYGSSLTTVYTRTRPSPSVCTQSHTGIDSTIDSNDLLNNKSNDVEAEMKLIFGDATETESKLQTLLPPADDLWMSHLLSNSPQQRENAYPSTMSSSMEASELLLSFASKEVLSTHQNIAAWSASEASQNSLGQGTLDSTDVSDLSQLITQTTPINSTASVDHSQSQIKYQCSSKALKPASFSTRAHGSSSQNLGISSPTNVSIKSLFVPTNSHAEAIVSESAVCSTIADHKWSSNNSFKDNQDLIFSETPFVRYQHSEPTITDPTDSSITPVISPTLDHSNLIETAPILAATLGDNSMKQAARNQSTASYTNSTDNFMNTVQPSALVLGPQRQIYPQSGTSNPKNQMTAKSTITPPVYQQSDSLSSILSRPSLDAPVSTQLILPSNDSQIQSTERFAPSCSSDNVTSNLFLPNYQTQHTSPFELPSSTIIASTISSPPDVSSAQISALLETSYDAQSMSDCGTSSIYIPQTTSTTNSFDDVSESFDCVSSPTSSIAPVAPAVPLTPEMDEKLSTDLLQTPSKTREPSKISKTCTKVDSPKPVIPLRTTRTGRTVATPKRFIDSEVYSPPTSKRKKEKSVKNGNKSR